MSRYRKGKIFEFEGMWIDRVPGSAFWYAFRYDRDAGKVRRETLGSDDLEEAKRVLVQRALVAAPKKPDSSLAAILTTYFQEVSDAKPSGEQARYAGRTILRFWGDEARASDVNEKTQKAFAEWSRDQDHSAAYIARNLSVLSAAMRHALGADVPKLWTWAPTVAEKLGMPDPGIREWIPTNEQLAAFLDALDSAQAQFTKDPITGITPIEQMLEVRDLPIQGSGIRDQGSRAEGQGTKGPGTNGPAGALENMQAMETPLVMGGFSPEAIRLWQQKMAGTGLEMVAAGGMGSALECGDCALGQGDCKHRAGIGGERATGAGRPGDCGYLHGDLH